MVQRRGGAYARPAFSHDAGQRIVNLVRHPHFVEYLRERQFTDPVEFPSP